jgi:hypothetical protein
VNDQLVPAVEPENDDLEQPPRRIEAQTQLTRRVLLIEITGELPVGRREDGVVRCDLVLSAEPWTLTRRKRGSPLV